MAARLSSLTLALRYAAFAAVATTVNVSTQYAGSMLYTGRYELYAAMAAGTLTGWSPSTTLTSAGYSRTGRPRYAITRSSSPAIH